jgi:hypothetical protein
MDFVASRESEKKFGWRNRVSEFLREFGVTVFDPWFKPEMYGIKEYGREDETTAKVREQWSFEPSEKGAEARASCADSFWPALHMDLRMVDTRLPCRVFRPTCTASAPRTRSFYAGSSAGPCFSSVRQFNFRVLNCAIIWPTGFTGMALPTQQLENQVPVKVIPRLPSLCTCH